MHTSDIHMYWVLHVHLYVLGITCTSICIKCYITHYALDIYNMY